MTSPLEAATAGMKEASLTIHQDGGNVNRVLFSLDLSMDDLANPEEVVTVPMCDIVAITLFNLARSQSRAFNDILLTVMQCVAEIAAAQADGATPETLASIREKYGVEFRAD